jgi:hypothetical protein
MRASFVKIPGLIIAVLALGSICILGVRAQQNTGNASSSTATTSSDFVQEGILITPPVTRERDSHSQPVVWIYHDGGTRRVPIRDAQRRSFDVFIDHKIGTTTPGAIYLNAYPAETNSVRVVHPNEFKQKVGDFDK